MKFYLLILTIWLICITIIYAIHNIESIIDVLMLLYCIKNKEE